MNQEGILSLREADEMLRRLRQSGPLVPPPTKIQLEGVCTRLLRNYQDSADRRFFNAFYHLSHDLFFAYALRHVRRFNCSLDPEDVAHRMYILLFEKLLAPGETIPWDYFFPWCYRVILNIVREERRQQVRAQPLIEDAARDLSTPSLLEGLIAAEEEAVEKLRLERVLDLLYSGASGLLQRDREVMRLFYLEGRSIREISGKLGLTRGHVGVILMRSRKRIARRLDTEMGDPRADKEGDSAD